MIYLINICLLVFLLTFKLQANENQKNKILFELNNKVFTNIDFERRLIYIEKINNLNLSEIKDLNKKEILDDFVSSLIFYEFNLINNIINENLDVKIENFYKKNILSHNSETNLNEKEILYLKNNIEIDLVRKIIIENILNSKRNILEKKTDNLDLIYNYNINYIIVDKNKIDSLIFDKIKNRNDFLNFKKYLKDNNIPFIIKNEDIDNSLIISNDLRKQLLNNKKISIYTNSKFIKIISLEKNLESYEGVFVKIFNYNSNDILDKEKLNCNYLKNKNDKIIYQEYEYSKLNQQIKDNLKSIDDYILIKNQGIYNYIFLCELRYNEQLLNTINFNKKVNSLAKKLQVKFIRKYKSEYNFKIYDE